MFLNRSSYLFFIFLFLVVVIPFAGVQANGFSTALEVEVNNAEVAQSPTPSPTLNPSEASTPSPAKTFQNHPTLFQPPGVLDSFNIGTGPLGGSWGGDTAGYSIVSNQLDVGLGEDIYWSAEIFSIRQEVFVTIVNLDENAKEIGLILKSQRPDNFSMGTINVLYNPPDEVVQVWTYTNPMGWQQRGSDIPAIFSSGQVFKAQVDEFGLVEIFQDNTSLGTVDVSTWPHIGNGGYIGLFNIEAENLILDDFGGGSSDGAPTLTPTPVPCTDPLTCDPVSAFTSYWRCYIPQCISSDWLGAVLAWPSYAAFENNGRNLQAAKITYSLEDDQLLYTYMGEWADGCEITAVSGTVLIIEWRRGQDAWEAFYINPPETHVVNLSSPPGQNGVLIEGPDNVVEEFRVSLSNCTPPTPVPISTITVGEISNSGTNEQNLANELYAQPITLSEDATVQNISVYLTHAAGQLRLGIYSDNSGSPGNLLAQTAAFNPVTGWNKENVITPVNLLPGNYWLAFLPQNDQMTFSRINSGTIRFVNQTFGPLPSTFPVSHSTGGFHYSLYSTMMVEGPTAIRLNNLEIRQSQVILPFIQIAFLLSIPLTLIIVISRKSKKSSDK